MMSLGAMCLVVALLASAPQALAINASPEAVDLQQPDGTRIRLHIRGDEYFHWFEDMRGYTVVWDGTQYVYANLNAAGQLAPTQMRVGLVNPTVTTLRTGTLPSPQTIALNRQNVLPTPRRAQGAASGSQSAVEAPPSAISPVGVVRNLVVLCQFSDHDATKIRPPADYDKVCNSLGGDPTLAPTGSVRDYYREASYGIVDLQSTVLVWVTLPHTEAYYANGTSGMGGSYPANPQGMVKDALDLADPLVDFGQFDANNDGFVDAIDIIHSGYGAETGGGGGNWIWSHKWSLYALPGGSWASQDNNANSVKVRVYDYHTEAALWSTTGTGITRIGVICHETGHFFGLPDLYDTDGTSEGIGSYCLMANSWGFDFTQQHPPHFSAWCKSQLGWVTPTIISPGAYSAPRTEDNQTVFRINNGYPSGEYLLIENRQPFGFETDMPQGGLAIWHIDENKGDNTSEGYPGQSGWPSNGKHYKIALLQADGLYGMEHKTNRGDAGDVYRGGGVSAITPYTVPNTDSYKGGVVTPTNNAITGISASSSSMTFTYAILTTPVITSSLAGFAPIGVPYSYQITASNTPTSYNATSLPAGFTISTSTGLISGTPSAIGTFNIALSATNASGTGNATLVLTIDPPAVITFPLSSDPGWTRTGEWAFGVPTGGGGTLFGNHDPTAGATGTKVFGVNLSGDYSTTVGGPYYLTTSALNLTGVTSSKLRFSRWLNTDYPAFAYATVDVSNNGTTWTTIYQNPASTGVADSAWTTMTYDISSVADNQNTVYVRWGYQIGIAGAFAYSGWNIDDVQVLGNQAAQGIPVTNVTSTASDGAYKAGATIPITVTFSSAVTVTGIPHIQLNSGASAYANYVSGSGTTMLTFNYVVGAGENAADLDYNSTVALTLNGGTIANASLTLPLPGATGSLGANKALVIDTTPPTVTVSPSGTAFNTATINFTITFSQAVSGLTVGGISVTNGTKGSLTGSGTTYNLPVTPTALGAVTCQVAAGAAQDTATNSSTVSNLASAVYDTIPPTVSVTPSGTQTKTSPIIFTFTFSESVNSLSTTGIAVVNGSKGTLTGSGIVYSLPVTPSGQGLVTCTANAGAAQDAATNPSTVSNTASVTYDSLPPILSLVHLNSNNASGTFAKVGDLITLGFTVSEDIQTPVVSLAGQAATVSNAGGNNWTASTTVTSGTPQGAVAISVVASDLVGNVATPTTTTSDASAVVVDRTPPTLSALHISSNNTSSTSAKLNDTITLTFTASEAIQTPFVTLAGQQAIVSNVGGNNWKATLSVTAGTPEGLATINAAFADFAGNLGTVTSVNDTSAVTVDRTPPVFNVIHVTSSNAAGTLAKSGDVITLNFTTSEAIKTPAVTLAGQSVTATNPSGDNWSATTIVAANTVEGNATVGIAITDLAGNVGVAASAATDASAVIIDRTPPALASLHLTSNNANLLYAKLGDTLTLTFTASESLQTPVVTLAGQSATLTDLGTNQWKATRVLTTGAPQGVAAMSVTYVDRAGNTGPPSTTTSDGSSISIDNLLPQFNGQPEPTIVNPGTPVTFTVTAVSLSPATYQWRKNNTPIPDATSNTFHLEAVVEGDQATYHCVVTNIVGSSFTQPVALSVNDPIVITSPPVDNTVNQGEFAELAMAVTGTLPIHYVWRKNGEPIAESDAPALDFATAGLSDAAYYDVIVTNIVGSHTTTPVYLTVLSGAPRITRQPASRTVEPEGPVTFSVVAVGSAPFTYQWRKNGVAISGATSETFAIDFAVNADAANYTVKVTNSAGSVISDAAVLAVKPAAYVFSTPFGAAGVAGSANASGPAARFSKPGYMVRDSSGNFFVTDRSNFVVRKIAVDGTVTTFAGTAGVTGITNGTGSEARFISPEGIGIDGNNNLYVADSGANTVRRITPAGEVTTFAGDPYHPGASSNGVGTLAAFNEPRGIAVGSTGIVYVSEGRNQMVRQIMPDGTVTSLAGLSATSGTEDGSGTAARFNRPAGLAVDAAGNVYVADEGNHAIRKITPEGEVTTVAGLKGTPGKTDAAGGAGRFKSPAGIAVEDSGVIFVSDTGNHTVRSISPSGMVRTPGGLAGTAGAADGKGSVARFRAARGITVDSAGHLYIADTDNNTIRKGILLPLPEITSQPQSLLVSLGQTAPFSIVAEGSPPLTYQWRKNAVNVSAAETSSKTPSYTTPPTTLANAGSYSVVVSNAAGSVTSAAARLGVVSIASSSVTVNEATALSLTATAAGESLTYEWRRNGMPLSNGGRVTGVATAKLSILDAHLADAGAYTCMVRMGDIARPTGTFTVSVRLKPVLTAFMHDDWITSGTVTDAITVEDLTPLNRPTSYSVTGLPQGMTFNKTTGHFGGKPNAPGHYSMTISATNAAGTRSQTIVIDIAPLPGASIGTFNGLADRNTTISSPLATPPTTTLQGHGGSLYNLVTTSVGTFTGTLKLEDKTYAMPAGSRLNAVAGENPTAAVTIIRGTATDTIADLKLEFTINKDTGELTGTVTDNLPASIPAPLHAWRNPWKLSSTPTSPAHPATALAGSYTALLKLDPALVGYEAHPTIPQGTGYVTLTLSNIGIATWGGKLADGTALSGSTTLGPNGELPLHLMLYTPTVAKAAGSVHGWMQAAPDSTPVQQNGGRPLLNGSVDWNKLAQASASTTLSYKSGFPLHSLAVTGGVYAASAPVLGLTDHGLNTNNAELIFTEGDIFHSSLAGPGSPAGSAAGTLHQLLRITTANKVIMPPGLTNNPGSVTLTLAASSGVISGNFTLKDTVSSVSAPRRVPWIGVLVPRLARGEGQFQLPQLPSPGSSPMLSGQVILQAAP